MVFMVMPFVVNNVFQSVQAQFEVPDAADPTDSIVECLDCFIKWTQRARAVAFTLESLQELQKCTREVMDLIKHTFPSRKMVNTATQHVDKPNTRVWDGLWLSLPPCSSVKNQRWLRRSRCWRQDIFWR